MKEKLGWGIFVVLFIAFDAQVYRLGNVEAAFINMVTFLGSMVGGAVFASVFAVMIYQSLSLVWFVTRKGNDGLHALQQIKKHHKELRIDVARVHERIAQGKRELERLQKLVTLLSVQLRDNGPLKQVKKKEELDQATRQLVNF